MRTHIDVCLLLEGTYPFVRGGVSSWVHTLIQDMRELNFGLVFIGGRRADYADPTYAVPSNVVHLECHYLEDSLRGCPAQRTRLSRRRAAEVLALHAAWKSLAGRAGSSAGGAVPILDECLESLERPGGVQLAQFLYSAGAWDIMCNAHAELGSEPPFLDYFWTLRVMHGPLFQLARVADAVPEAGAYHSISTGYAGFLGALLERRRRRPLILTEHGIYTKERRIDLNQSGWFEPTRAAGSSGLSEPRGVLRELWVRYFESLGRMAYRSADPIVSLFEAARQRQVSDGAPAARTRVLPNGVDPARFARALGSRGSAIPPVIGLIGRVVPIKDVKTFIRVIGGVARVLPNVQGWVIGSADEDPEYAAECRALVRSARLEAHVVFLGHQPIAEVLPKLGLVMLTSISEGQPLAVLEAFSAGVPCVVTDVGACREQIEGRDAADRVLGLAGRVAPFADAGALAQFAIELLTQPSQWRAAQAAGLARVRRCYAQASMLEAYRAIYQGALER